MCMSVCVYIYVYICVCIYACVYTYVCFYVYMYMYMYIYIYIYIYQLYILTFNVNYFNKKSFQTEYLTEAYSEPSRTFSMQLSANGFERYIAFQKGVLSGIFRGVLNTTLIQLTIFCFFLISWNVPLQSGCKYLWWRLVLCGDQTNDLQDELSGWFLYGLGFYRGYFRTDYSIVFQTFSLQFA